MNGAWEQPLVTAEDGLAAVAVISARNVRVGALSESWERKANSMTRPVLSVSVWRHHEYAICIGFTLHTRGSTHKRSHVRQGVSDLTQRITQSRGDHQADSEKPGLVR